MDGADEPKAGGASQARGKAQARRPPAGGQKSQGFSAGRCSLGSPALADEINMLRLVIRRVFDSAGEVEMGMEQWSELLETLGRGAVRLATLMRSQKQMAGSQQSQIEAAFNQALAEVLAEKGLR